jgi:shikimate 5-dehydrogenase
VKNFFKPPQRHGISEHPLPEQHSINPADLCSDTRKRSGNGRNGGAGRCQQSMNRQICLKQRHSEAQGTQITVHPWSEARNVQRHAGLLVNTTSLGMIGEPPLALDLMLPPTAPVVDIVYVPLETDLLTTARRRGNPVVDGLGMLLHQGRPGFEAWFGASVRVTPELRARIVATLAPP